MEETTMREETEIHEETETHEEMETFKKFISFIKNHKFICTEAAAIIVIFVTMLIFRDRTVDFLKFCDRHHASIAVIVTVIVSFITISITIDQYFTKKRNGKIRIYNLYNTIDSILISHISAIESLLRKNNPQYIDSAAKERKFSNEEMKLIFELEKLLYEHGMSNDENYIKDIISIISVMRELAYSINTIYDVFEMKNSTDIKESNEFADFLKFAEKSCTKIREYRENTLHNYIKI